ncbi:MAG: acetyl-CoA C-acyltransferase [Dermatophilaceae bacterium]
MTSTHPRVARRVAVLGGNRIPFMRAGGAYAGVGNQQLLTAALDGLVERFHLAGERMGEVVAGAVLKHSRDFNLTREAVLGTGLAPSTPAYDIQQACATGLEAAVLVANKIALGQIDSGIAGGADSISDSPPVRPVEPRTGLTMGEHMAVTAQAWGITRHDQDAFAVASHRGLAAAYDRGFFDDLMTPYRGHTRDDILRVDASMQSLGALPAVFGDTMTAGNCTPLTDGASVVLLASEPWARARGLTPLAWFVDAQTAAVDYVGGVEGMLMAPVYALPPLLHRLGMRLQDFAEVEIHEAFAATVLATLAAWESADFCRTRLGLPTPVGRVQRARLNVHGSSLAAGHPFAASGARILAGLAKSLHERGSGRGLASVCAAGGQGVLAVLDAA